MTRYRMLAKMMAMLLCCAMLCGSGIAAVAEENETPVIVTTGFPCYDLVSRIVGEHASVRLLIRPGTEVHSYEPTPADIVMISEAELFVYIGGASDAWVEEILASFGGTIPCVRIMDDVEGLETVHDHDHGHDHGGVGHDELDLDEHIWTSPKRAEIMLRVIEEAICAVMPEHEEEFRANADAYASEIAAIDEELEAIVEGAVRTKLVFADRFPFLYMAHDYHLSYAAAFTSCAEDTEPSALTMVNLIQEVLEDGIPVIYIIEMSTGIIARTIAEETGAEILTLHSIQNVTQEEFDAGETYVSLMRKNLEAIRRGLY